MPAKCLFLAAFCTLITPAMAPAPAHPRPPTIEIGYTGDDLQFTVDHPTQIFIGAAIGSLTPDLTHYLIDIPPLLSDHVIFGAGIGYPGEGVPVRVPQDNLPRGVPIYVQGVTMVPELGIEASEVESITLPIVVAGSVGGE